MARHRVFCPSASRIEAGELRHGTFQTHGHHYSGNGFPVLGMIHHDDLRFPRLQRVNLMDYPPGAVHRIVDECRYRRDPIVRGCLYAGGAFIWSQINHIIVLDRHDRTAFELGSREGLNEGILIPLKLNPRF
jgi:hypothetical protein